MEKGVIMVQDDPRTEGQMRPEELDKGAVKELKKAAKDRKKEEKKPPKAGEVGQRAAAGQVQAAPESEGKRLDGRKLDGWKNKMGVNLYVDEIELRACDVDLGNRWRPSSLFVATQEFGEQHSIFLNYGHQKLADAGVFFILLRQRAEVIKYPGTADVLRCETWAGEIQRTMFPRFYRFYDGEGMLCATSSTVWALFSVEERKIIRPQDIGVVLPPPPYENLPEPGKLRFTEAPDLVKRHTVRYSDLDYNGHVNNTRYVDWCCDLFPIERFAEHSFRSIQVNYVREMRQGGEMRLEMRDMGDSFAVQGLNQEDGQVIFQAAGSWMHAPKNSHGYNRG